MMIIMEFSSVGVPMYLKRVGDLWKFSMFGVLVYSMIVSVK